MAAEHGTVVSRHRDGGQGHKLAVTRKRLGSAWKAGDALFINVRLIITSIIIYLEGGGVSGAGGWKAEAGAGFLVKEAAALLGAWRCLGEGSSEKARSQGSEAES